MIMPLHHYNYDSFLNIMKAIIIGAIIGIVQLFL